jgi:N-methylhydantoinase A
VGERRLILPTERGAVRAPAFRRELLRAGNRIDGPAVVEQMDATTLLLGGQRARVDAGGNLWIEEARR